MYAFCIWAFTASYWFGGKMAGNMRKAANDASMKSSGGALFLIEPETNKNSGKIAMQLAQCKGVSEVRLTSGKFGFVVFCKEKNKEALTNLSKICGNKVSMLENHSIYKIR